MPQLGEEAMKNIHTVISYSLRLVVVLHASLLLLLFLFQKSQVPATNSILILTVAVILLVLTLLIADLTTRKDRARRFSKVIDSIVGLGWVLTILAAVLRSLSMGTL
jgi:4-hydroxybenzoate polyprenyltransferase